MRGWIMRLLWLSLGFYLCALICPWFFSNAFAGEITLSWVNATENTDGTPYDDPKLNIIKYGACTETGLVPSDGTRIELPPTTTQYVIENVTPGTYCIWAKHENQAGIRSDRSAIVQKVVAAAPPLPPAGLTIAGESAYIIVQSDDTVVLLDIGTVAGDVPCDGTVAVLDDNGLIGYKVPISAVTPYSASQQLVVAFAQCGN